MEQLYSLIIDATNHILRSMHVIYSLLALAVFVYITSGLVEAVRNLPYVPFETVTGKITNIANVAVWATGFLLMLYLFFG